MENLKPIMKHLRLKLWNILLKNWPEFFQNVGAVKDQKKKKKGWEIVWEERITKETWQLNALHDPGLDPIQGNEMP